MCPISLTLMNNPVNVVHGHTFDRDSIMSWFAKGGRKNPLSNLPLNDFYLRPNKKLRH